MKWLKTAAKCVSNLNAQGNKPKGLKNALGMSLVELMIVTGISSTIMLGAGSVMVFVADSFSKIIDKDDAEGSLTRAAYALRTVATQAVGLYVAAPGAAGEGIGETAEAGGDQSTAMYKGQILWTLDTTGLGNGQMAEVAQFHRETAATTAGNSYYMPTAIYFKTPWATCPPNGANNVVGVGGTYAGTRENCSGQLVMVWNTGGIGTNLTNVITSATNVVNGANSDVTQLAAQPGGNIQTQIFDRFTSLVLTATGVAGAGAAGVGSYARDARFRLTVRYFLGLDPSTWNYLPAANTHNAKELSMEVYVGFRNNYQGKSQVTNNEPERLHGSPYYFPFVSSIPVWL